VSQGEMAEDKPHTPEPKRTRDNGTTPQRNTEIGPPSEALADLELGEDIPGLIPNNSDDDSDMDDDEATRALQDQLLEQDMAEEREQGWPSSSSRDVMRPQGGNATSLNPRPIQIIPSTAPAASRTRPSVVSAPAASIPAQPQPAANPHFQNLTDVMVHLTHTTDTLVTDEDIETTLNADIEDFASTQPIFANKVVLVQQISAKGFVLRAANEVKDYLLGIGEVEIFVGSMEDGCEVITMNTRKCNESGRFLEKPEEAARRRADSQVRWAAMKEQQKLRTLMFFLKCPPKYLGHGEDTQALFVAKIKRTFESSFPSAEIDVLREKMRRTKVPRNSYKVYVRFPFEPTSQTCIDEPAALASVKFINVLTGPPIQCMLPIMLPKPVQRKLGIKACCFRPVCQLNSNGKCIQKGTSYLGPQVNSDAEFYRERRAAAKRMREQAEEAEADYILNQIKGQRARIPKSARPCGLFKAGMCKLEGCDYAHAIETARNIPCCTVRKNGSYCAFDPGQCIYGGCLNGNQDATR